VAQLLLLQAYEQKQKAISQAASRRLRTSTYLRRSVLHATGRANREERTPEKGEEAERPKHMSREDVNELEVARHPPPFQGGEVREADGVVKNDAKPPYKGSRLKKRMLRSYRKQAMPPAWLHCAAHE